MFIYTHDKVEHEFPNDTCWREPMASCPPNTKGYLLFKNGKIVSIHFEQKDKWVIRLIDLQEWMSLHPNSEYYNALKRIREWDGVMLRSILEKLGRDEL